MITRGLRTLALFWVALAAGTAVVSLVVGAALDVPAQRSVSGGLMLVGSIVFTAGAAAGIRDPARSSRRERLLRRGPGDSRPSSWRDAFQLSAALVGLGMALVLVGVVLHPRSSL